MTIKSAVALILLISCLPDVHVAAGEMNNVQVSFLRPERSESHRSGYCRGTRVKRGNIELIPVTIGTGLSIPEGKTQKEAQEYFNTYFQKNVEYAERAGVNLFMNTEDFYSVGTNDGWFFLLYYNLASAENCKRDYLIQRVKVTAGSYGKGGRSAYREKTLYLVEVMKLNKDRKTGKGDQHLRVYSLGKAYKRKIEVECEIGWGCIRGDLEKDEWPYGETVLYKELQGYSERPGIYDRIRFEVSRKYMTKIEFDKDGKGSVQLPVFMRGGR